jgi:DNA replication protein DnaC
MFKVELYGRVRRAVRVEGRSERAVALEFGISRETVRKMLRYAVPPGYQRQQPVKRPKLGRGWSRSTRFPVDTPQVLLEHHLKALRLPTFLREYDKVARQCAAEDVDYPRYLLRMSELELLDRERRATERRVRQAKFPVVKSLDSFDFLAIPSLNKAMVLELVRCEFLLRRENVLLLGNSGTGKTHVALALGLAACQRGQRVRFTTAAALVHELMEARDEKKLLRFQKQIAAYELLIVDELGFVPLSKTGAELLFEVFSQRYERTSTLVTSNLPFQEWTEILGSERLTGALLDRLTHHVHILEMNGDSYRLKQSRHKRGPANPRPPLHQHNHPATVRPGSGGGGGAGPQTKTPHIQ